MIRQATAREIIQMALMDAIDWQITFRDAQSRGTPEEAGAIARIAAYQALYTRRYGGSYP